MHWKELGTADNLRNLQFDWSVSTVIDKQDVSASPPAANTATASIST